MPGQIAPGKIAPGQGTAVQGGQARPGQGTAVQGGHMSALWAQAGLLVVLGDAGADLGDSIYEARLYVRGQAASLGADCIEKDMRDEHRAELVELLERAGMDANPDAFRRYGSARKLYNFNIEHLDQY